jgi:protein-L-isoaspartate O-methyltransferase
MMTVSQKWDKRVAQWHDHVNSAAAFGKVLDRILVLSQPQPSDICVDLGAGTGFVTTALAPLVASVRAVDISPAMTEALAERAADAGLANVSTEVTNLKDPLRPPRRAGAPGTPEFWQQALRDAGLTEVSFHPVAAEAGIVCGVRPTSGRGGR